MTVQMAYLQWLCVPHLVLLAMFVLGPGALGVLGGTLEGVRVPKELGLDPPHNHGLPSMAELLLEHPADHGCDQ